MASNRSLTSCSTELDPGLHRLFVFLDRLNYRYDASETTENDVSGFERRLEETTETLPPPPFFLLSILWGAVVEQLVTRVLKYGQLKGQLWPHETNLL